MRRLTEPCRRRDCFPKRLEGPFQETRGSLSRDSGVSSKRLRVSSKRLGGLFQETLGSLSRDSGVSFKRLWGLFRETLGSLSRDSGVSSKRLVGLFQETPGVLARDPGGSSKRLRGFLQETPGVLPRDSGGSCKRPRGFFQETPGVLARDPGGSCKSLGGSFKRLRGFFKETPGALSRDSRGSRRLTLMLPDLSAELCRIPNASRFRVAPFYQAIPADSPAGAGERSCAGTHRQAAERDKARGQEPVEPFSIAGNLYYVGANDVSAFLITGPAGHIVLDGGYPTTAPMIMASIAKLDFNIKDVKVLLNSEPHPDHAGGLGVIEKASGAELWASEASAYRLASGEAMIRTSSCRCGLSSASGSSATRPLGSTTCSRMETRSASGRSHSPRTSPRLHFMVVPSS
jgi:hypothetical protein